MTSQVNKQRLEDLLHSLRVRSQPAGPSLPYWYICQSNIVQEAPRYSAQLSSAVAITHLRCFWCLLRRTSINLASMETRHKRLGETIDSW